MCPNHTSFEFIGLYSTQSIRSVITIKHTRKYKYSAFNDMFGNLKEL